MFEPRRTRPSTLPCDPNPPTLQSKIQRSRLREATLVALGILWATTATAICTNVDDPHQVLDFYLEMDPSDWNAILHDSSYSDERPAYFSCGDESPLYVSVRRKATLAIPSDSNPQKVSLKIDIDEFVSGQEWNSHRKISLENGEGSNLIVEGVAWLLMARAGVIGPGATWVRVHVNGEAVGIYTRVEQIDKAFLRRHVGEDEGFLYKEGEQRTRESETDPYAPDLCYEPFDRHCNLPPDGYGSLADHCNVHQLMLHGAVNAFMVNDDGLLAKENNLWWYNSPQPRLYFPWDLDTVFRPSDFNVDPHDFGRGQQDFQVLLLADPGLRAFFDDILARLAADSFTADALSNFLDDIEATVGPEIEADPLNDLEGSVASEIADLKTWIGNRVAHLESTLPPVERSPIVINEILASNTISGQDEGGEYADWVELFNRSGSPVSLAGHSLTDDPARPRRWALPDITLGPGDYQVVWCDNDTLQGPMHTGFRLDADGERIGLYGDGPYGPQVMDHVWFGPQLSDVSLGRLGDGDPGHILLTQPTPGQPNAQGRPLVLLLADPPASVPRGTHLVFTAEVRNVGDGPDVFDAATLDVTGPAGLQMDLYRGGDLSVAPGNPLVTQVRIYVPSAAPVGNYRLELAIEDNGSMVSESGFNIDVQ